MFLLFKIELLVLKTVFNKACIENWDLNSWADFSQISWLGRNFYYVRLNSMQLLSLCFIKSNIVDTSFKARIVLPKWYMLPN